MVSLIHSTVDTVGKRYKQSSFVIQEKRDAKRQYSTINSDVTCSSSKKELIINLQNHLVAQIIYNQRQEFLQ